jgi:FAD dependent monooxygenase
MKVIWVTNTGSLGYPFTVMARQKLLQSLFDQLKDKTKIYLKKRVTTVTQVANSIVVKCGDGTEYIGDIVVGADGIHSRVREEMRRHAEQTGPPGLVENDKSSKSSINRAASTNGVESINVLATPM